MKINSREELNHLQEFYSSRLHAQTKRILVCAGTGCVAGGSLLIYARLKELMEEQGIRCEVVLEEEPHEHADGAGHTCHCEESAPEGARIGLKKSGCHGFCEMGPLLRIDPEGLLYIKVKVEDCEEIIERSILKDEIVERLVYQDLGANGLAKYLDQHGIHKIQRQNGKNPLFDAALIRRILKNPVYCGKIAYGRRRTEKVHGTRNDYRLVEQDDYLLVDGQHEGIVSEELWHEAQVKLLAQAEKYEHVNRGKDTKVHLLSGIVKCPICGAGMYGNKSIKHKSDGTKYKDFFYYGCKHRTMTRGHKCDYRKQIHEELLDSAVAEVIVKLVSNPKFAAMMQEKINMKVDTAAIEQEIANYEKQLRQSYSVKSKLMEEIDSLDPDDKHYYKRKADLDDRLYKMYDKIEDTENLLIAARAKKMAIEAEKLTGDNIYKVLIYFDKLYAVMSEQEKRQIMEALISEIQIYEERQPNGQWLKSIKFKLPIIEEDMSLSLDNDTHVETVVLLSRKTPDDTIEVDLNLDELDATSAETKATYEEIKKYVKEKYQLKVSNLYISQIKRKCGIEVGINYNLPKSENPKVPQCPPEKERAIRDALEHFQMVS